MASKIKVTRAYCIELKKNVSADEIHFESIRNGKPHRKFSFLCTDSHCQSRGVNIIGVAYDKLPSERKVTIHFRANPRSVDHHPDCEWVAATSYAEYEGVYENETKEDADIRRKRHIKVDDYIEIYAPKLNEPKVDSTDDSALNPIDIKKSGVESSASTRRNNQSNQNRTASFYRLVNNYHDMQTQLGLEALQRITLEVTGLGKITWANFFAFFPTKMKYPFNGIMHGLIKSNIRRYGAGFLIYFRSKYKNLNVSIYISPRMLGTYRNRREILDVLENASEMTHITAYFIPSDCQLVTLESGVEEYQFIIDDLRQFSLVGDA